MKHVLTFIAVFALIATIPGCDGGGTRGPTAEQQEQAQQIEQEFAPLRDEVQNLIRQHEGSTDDEVQAVVIDLEMTLHTAESEVQALRTAPRDDWESYKTAAEYAIEALRVQLELARQTI